MPASLFLSSGNLIADRRYDFGRDLMLRGDLAAAADLMAQAAELEPGFASAWFALGDLREQQGLRDEAIAAFLRARDTDPDDRHGATLRLMRLGAENLSAMPPGYVRALFDQYAPRFDKTPLSMCRNSIHSCTRPRAFSSRRGCWRSRWRRIPAMA